MQPLIACSITGTGSSLPERVVSNDELAQSLHVDSDWILKRTGIRERRWCSPEIATSDLAISASKAALADAGVSAAEVDLVIVATSTPDWPQPPTAARVHGTLGMRPDAAAFDVDGVCSGWIHAMHLGSAMLAAHAHWQHVLVVGADTYSRITNPSDRSTRILFGDGAGAALLSHNPQTDTGILATHAFTNFAGHEALQVAAGGSREPITAEALIAQRNYFSMDGRAVREFGVREMCNAFTSLSTAVDGAHPDLLILHQSNLRMLEAACETLGFDQTHMATTIEHAGNTAAASIPLTLDAARRQGRIYPGALIAMIGYGGGLSAAGLLYRA